MTTVTPPDADEAAPAAAGTDPVDRGADPADAPRDAAGPPFGATRARRRWNRWGDDGVARAIEAAVVLTACLFVFLQMQPNLLFAATTPNGGDMGAHVWAPAYLRDELLPRFRLSGWTPDWYAGFPAMHFYMVLPMLAIVILDLVLPYGVAFKLVTVLGVVSLPASAWFLGRSLRLPQPIPPLFAVAAVMFAFDRSFTIWGGNVASTLAGEFAYSISLSLALVFLGVFARSLDTGRHRASSAVLLALTALTHLIPAIFAGVAAVVLTLLRPTARSARLLATTMVVGGAIGAFWALPFVWRRPYLNDMGWEKTTDYVGSLYPDGMRGLIALAAAGAMAALLRRMRGGVFLIIVVGFLALAFVTTPQGRLWNTRLLPFLYLSFHLLAAIGIGSLVRELASAIADEERVRRTLRLGGAVATWFLVFIVIGRPLGAVPDWLNVPETDDSSFVTGWARWNYAGYERKDAWDEYSGIVDTMATLGEQRGCGRAMWEYDRSLDRYGTPMALMLLPHWTDGCIGSMEGLYFEASASTPYHFLNQSELSVNPSRPQRGLEYRTLVSKEDLDGDGEVGDAEGVADPTVFAAGIEHLQRFGVRYYMSLHEATRVASDGHPDLTRVATSDPWTVYEIAGSELVEPLVHEPVVVTGTATGGEAWLEVAEAHHNDRSEADVLIAASGPDEWDRLPVDAVQASLSSTLVADDGGAVPLPRTSLPRVEVSDIDVGVDTISFSVSDVGVPVLVKASYFPNWTASGADGPYRVTPNLMVVVPTDKDVSLRYGRTPVDLIAWLITFAGIAAAVALWRRDRAPDAADEAPDEGAMGDDDEPDGGPTPVDGGAVEEWETSASVVASGETEPVPPDLT